MIVWVVGTEDHQTGGDQRLHGYDGETGAVVYSGGGPNELMAGTHYYRTLTGIVARGRIYVAGDNKVYAFALPGGTPTPTPTTTPTVTPTTNTDTDCDQRLRQRRPRDLRRRPDLVQIRGRVQHRHVNARIE